MIILALLLRSSRGQIPTSKCFHGTPLLPLEPSTPSHFTVASNTASCTLSVSRTKMKESKLAEKSQYLLERLIKSTVKCSYQHKARAKEEQAPLIDPIKLKLETKLNEVSDGPPNNSDTEVFNFYECNEELEKISWQKGFICCERSIDPVAKQLEPDPQYTFIPIEHVAVLW